MSDDLDLDALEAIIANRRQWSHGHVEWRLEVAEQLIALARRTQSLEAYEVPNEEYMTRAYLECRAERDAALARTADLEAALGRIAGWDPAHGLGYEGPQAVAGRALARSVPVPQEPKPPPQPANREWVCYNGPVTVNGQTVTFQARIGQLYYVDDDGNVWEAA